MTLLAAQKNDPVSNITEDDPISNLSNNNRTFLSLPYQEQFFGDVNCLSNPLDVYKLFITEELMFP